MAERKRFRLHHEPEASKRHTWKEAESEMDFLRGQTVTASMSGSGNQRENQVVQHKLGRVPEQVQIMAIHPADDESPFVCWELISRRTKTTITLRTDSIHAGDKVTVKVR